MNPHQSPRFRRQSLQVEVNAKARPGYGVAWRIALICLVIMFAGIFYVGMRSSSDNMARDLQNKRRTEAIGKKEIENMQAELESYKSPRYILSKIGTLDTALRPPMPGQVRRLTVEGSQNRGDFSDISLAAFDTPVGRDSRSAISASGTVTSAVGYP